jgi:acetyl-CoA carboxylase biotin carboxyl carrier protein
VIDPQPGSASSSSSNGIDEQERLADLVHSFITMMKAGNMARLDLKYRDLRLSLRAHGEAVVTSATPASSASTAAASTVVADDTDESYHTIAAPMIGTFYAAPAPSEPPFVRPGDHVTEGQTIGIIEAMKIMNEIAADRSGTVIEIVAQNAQSVEYGSPLVRISIDPA